MIVCYILPIAHGFGGAEVFVKRLACEARRRSIETHFFSIFNDPDPGVASELAHAGVIVHSFRKHKTGFSLPLAIWLAWKLAKIRPNVIHSHLHVSKYLIPFRFLFARARWIHTIHSFPAKDAPGIERIFNLIAVFLGMRLVAISSSLANDAKKYYKHRMPFVPNGIAISSMEKNTKPSRFVFGCMARLSPEKDLRTLILAFSRFRCDFPDSFLKIAGDGPELSALIGYRDSLGLQKVISFLGVVRDPSDFWPDINAFVLTSKYEGMPMTILEAMAFEIPVIAPQVGGIPEMLDQGKCGFLYPPGNIEALVGKMAFVATHDCVQVVADAKFRCLERYSISSALSKYLSICRISGYA